MSDLFRSKALTVSDNMVMKSIMGKCSSFELFAVSHSAYLIINHFLLDGNIGTFMGLFLYLPLRPSTAYSTPAL